MAISSEDIQKVRDASDIVEVFSERVPLRQRGREFWCCCPFHEEKTPSCKVDPNTQLFYCFGCHKGGDVFKFVQEIEGIEFPDAVRRLAERAHIELQETAGRGPSQGEKARLKDVCREASEFFHLQLMRGRSSEANAARMYLANRGFGGEVPKKWKLGFAPGKGELVAHLRTRGFANKEMIDANVAVERNGRVSDRFFNRVMFPIFDEVGDCIAFGGRVMGNDEPKYLNSQETPLFHKSRVLYGLDKAKAGITATGVAIVVEGYTDVIACHEAGVTNVVATLGTALTKQHIRSISRHASKRIVYLFDGDAAGQRAADRALEFIGESMTPEAGKRRIDLVACTLPDNLDPADFIANEGADALRAAVEEAQPLISFGIERRLAAFDTETAEGRASAVTEALAVLAPIKDSLLAKDYAIQIAGRLHLRENDVLDRLAKLKAPRVSYNDDSAPSYAAGSSASQSIDASEPVPEPIQLTETEISRRSYEGNLLGVCAKEPRLVQQYSSELAGINWHDPLHSAVASQLLDILAKDPSASAASIVAAITTTLPASARLFATSAGDAQGAEAYVAYALEALSMGDLEEAVDVYHAQLKNPEGLSSEEQDLLLETVTQLQKELNERKTAHARISIQ